MWEQISFAFLFGIISSIGICLASCTPVLIAYLASIERDPRKFIAWTILFIAMRAVVFILVTLTILMLGRIALAFLQEYALLLRVIGGSFIAIAGVLVFFDIGTRLKFFKTKSKGFILISILFGIKPCIPHIAIWGYLLTTVAAPMVDGALSLPGAIAAALVIALSFSLGENIVPAILGLLGGQSIRFLYRKAFRIVSKVCGAMLFVLGIIFVFYDRVAPVLLGIIH